MSAFCGQPGMRGDRSVGIPHPRTMRPRRDFAAPILMCGQTTSRFGCSTTVVRTMVSLASMREKDVGGLELTKRGCRLALLQTWLAAAALKLMT